MAILPDADRPRRSDSMDAARSIELLERWVAGDDGALQEWIGVDRPQDPLGPWVRIVAVARTLSQALPPRRGPATLGESSAARRGGARYKYPVEGR